MSAPQSDNRTIGKAREGGTDGGTLELSQGSRHLVTQSVRSQDPSWQPLPVAFGSRQGEMSYARGRQGIRRTQGRAQRQLQAWSIHRNDRPASVTTTLQIGTAFV